MTKFKDLLGEVKSDIKEDKEVFAKDALRESLADVRAAEKTLKRVQERHEELLEKDIDDVDLDDFRY